MTVPDLRDRLLRNAFIQNTVSLISGTVVTQVIVFVCSPVLSRFFTPEDMGAFANYTAWVAVLALVSSLRYEHAILVAADEAGAERALALTGALSGLSAAVFSVLAIAILIVRPDVSYLRAVRDVVFYIPIGVLFVCFTSALTQLNIRAGEFRHIARVTVVQSIATISVQVGTGIAHVRGGLVIGVIVGYAVAGALFARSTLDKSRLRGLRELLRRPILAETARLHLAFPRYTLGADAIAVLTQQFAPVVITALFSPVQAGLFAFATRVARVPLLIISTAVAGVLRKDAAERANAGRPLRGLFSKTMWGMGALAVGPLAVLVLAGPELFRFVFGEQWLEAGRIARILSPAMVLEFVAMPASVFLLVTRSQHYGFRVQAVGLVMLLAAFAAGRFWLNDFGSTCLLVAITTAGINVAGITFAWRGVKRFEREPSRADQAPLAPAS